VRVLDDCLNAGVVERLLQAAAGRRACKRLDVVVSGRITPTCGPLLPAGVVPPPARWYAAAAIAAGAARSERQRHRGDAGGGEMSARLLRIGCHALRICSANALECFGREHITETAVARTNCTKSLPIGTTGRVRAESEGRTA